MDTRRLNRVESPLGAMAGSDAEDVGQAAGRAEQDRERSLIRRAQQGEHDAFEALLRRHQRRVLALIGQLLHRPADVEDVAQQVFLKVYLALPRFDFRAAFSTWLYRIVVNECYDYLRRRRARKSPVGAEVAVEDLAALEHLGGSATQPAPVDVAAQTQLRQVVEKLFRRLPPEDQLVLTLKELEGFSVEEIGQIMHLRENTVKVRLFRARRRLLEAYQRIVRPKER